MGMHDRPVHGAEGRHARLRLRSPRGPEDSAPFNPMAPERSVHSGERSRWFATGLVLGEAFGCEGAVIRRVVAPCV